MACHFVPITTANVTRLLRVTSHAVCSFLIRPSRVVVVIEAAVAVAFMLEATGKKTSSYGPMDEELI